MESSATKVAELKAAASTISAVGDAVFNSF
jgi:hypothetical protein